MATTKIILRHARYLDELDPGFLAKVIMAETGQDYRKRDLLDQVARLIEIFGVEGAAHIVGCPRTSRGDEPEVT